MAVRNAIKIAISRLLENRGLLGICPLKMAVRGLLAGC